MSYLSRGLIARLSLLAILATILLVLAGCKTSSSVTTDQAARAAQTIEGSVVLVMAHQNSWAPPPPYTTNTSVSYSAAGLNMTGTVTISGSTTTYALTITFSNYADAATGYTVNGTFNFSQTNTSTDESGTATGNLIFSGGPVTNTTWNTSFTASAGGPPTFTGTITCDGASFDPNTLLANALQAQTAEQAVVNVLANVLGSQTSWTPSSSTWTPSNTFTVSYSATGVSMTSGTVTISASGTTYTYVVPISLSNYVAGGTSYTLSGTVTWSVVENTTAPATYSSGTVTANLTLTGGPVTAETWNLSSVSGITTAPVFGGIITCNGTSFDAKTI